MGRHYACIVNEMSYICMLLFCTFAYGNNVQHSHLMKKIINPYLGKKGYKCICCSPDNPIGLHLQFWEEGDEVLTKCKSGKTKCTRFEKRNVQKSGKTKRAKKFAHTTL